MWKNKDPPSLPYLSQELQMKLALQHSSCLSLSLGALRVSRSTQQQGAQIIKWGIIMCYLTSYTLQIFLLAKMTHRGHLLLYTYFISIYKVMRLFCQETVSTHSQFIVFFFSDQKVTWKVHDHFISLKLDLLLACLVFHWNSRLQWGHFRRLFERRCLCAVSAWFWHERWGDIHEYDKLPIEWPSLCVKPTWSEAPTTMSNSNTIAPVWRDVARRQTMAFIPLMWHWLDLIVMMRACHPLHLPPKVKWYCSSEVMEST